MKNCGRRNVKKHKDIKGSNDFFTLDISSKFYKLDKMKITSSESKVQLEISGKGLMTSLGFKPKSRSQRYKKEKYAIINVSKKDPSMIIKEFEKIEKIPYEKKRRKNEPTESYFRLERQLAKCMMRSDKPNWNDHGGYTEMTEPSLNANATDEDESKRIIVHKTVSGNFYTDVSKEKPNIVNKNLP